MNEITEHHCGFDRSFIEIKKSSNDWFIFISGEATISASFCPYCGFDLTAGDYTIGSSLIAAERVRQVQVEGYDAKRDEKSGGALPLAAIAYIVSSTPLVTFPWDGFIANPNFWWPFDREYLKPKTPIKDLVRAGSLLCAEIDRLWRTGERLEEEQ